MACFFKPQIGEYTSMKALSVKGSIKKFNNDSRPIEDDSHLSPRETSQGDEVSSYKGKVKD